MFKKDVIILVSHYPLLFFTFMQFILTLPQKLSAEPSGVTGKNNKMTG
jgi:hypothetical protein